MMRSISLSFARLVAILLLPFVIGLSAQVAAVDVFPCEGKAVSTDVCQNVKDPANAGKNPIIGLVKSVITVLSIIIGVAAVIAIIVGGLSLITSSGDAQAIANARRSIIYALIGVVIVLIAQALVAFVLNKL